MDEKAQDYPYIYFTTPVLNEKDNYLYRTVCVKECPLNLINQIYTAQIKCLPNSLVPECKFIAQPNNVSVLFYDTVPCKTLSELILYRIMSCINDFFYFSLTNLITFY